jgi:hypothetical protein
LDYQQGAFTWSGNGCGTSMVEWITGSGITSCREQGNQFSTFTLGYDASICEDYCEVIPDFVLTNTTELDASTDPLLFERGAIQFTDLFTWTKVCPQSQVYCASALLRTANKEMIAIQIFPNPAVQQAALSFESVASGTATITIYEAVTGRVILSKKVNLQDAGQQQVQLQLPVLAEGIYPVRIQTADQLQYGKISIR